MPRMEIDHQVILVWVCVEGVGSESCRIDVTRSSAAACQVLTSLPFTFLSLASSKVSGVVLNCINMQEFIDYLPWHFCWEGNRVLQSPSVLITGSWQCYLSLVKDKPRHRAVTHRTEGAHLPGSLQEEGCLRGIFTLMCLISH